MIETASSSFFEQDERLKLFESFLISGEMKECLHKLSVAKFARLTQGFTPRDLKKAAGEIEMKILASSSEEGKNFGHLPSLVVVSENFLINAKIKAFILFALLLMCLFFTETAFFVSHGKNNVFSLHLEGRS